jgi:hypothetical protein
MLIGILRKHLILQYKKLQNPELSPKHKGIQSFFEILILHYFTKMFETFPETVILHV